MDPSFTILQRRKSVGNRKQAWRFVGSISDKHVLCVMKYKTNISYSNHSMVGFHHREIFQKLITQEEIHLHCFCYNRHDLTSKARPFCQDDEQFSIFAAAIRIKSNSCKYLVTMIANVVVVILVVSYCLVGLSMRKNLDKLISKNNWFSSWWILICKVSYATKQRLVFILVEY